MKVSSVVGRMLAQLVSEVTAKRRAVGAKRHETHVFGCDRSSRHRLAAARALALCVIGAGACGGGASRGASASPKPVAPLARISITPSGGARGVKPAHGIGVRVTGGKIVSVIVRTTGDRATGTMNAAVTAWHSRWALDVNARYTVRVTAIDTTGRTVKKTSTFRTLTPQQTFSTLVFEGQGQSYGVGMPIILRFDRPITARRAVERSLTLWTSRWVVGAWFWDGDTTLYFRPRSYWPAHTRVRLVAHLNGIEGAPGVYGAHTLTQSFAIGRSLIAVADTQTHHVRVYLNKRLFADWPMSSGRPGDDTPNGTYLAIDKENPADMIGPGYNIEVPWSVRFTWSGDYLHDAYWSVGQQGFANVSHGCVNLSPADAQTYYQMALAGDPVTITGSPRGGTWDNGWTVWFLRWRTLVRGSALREAVISGPHGSTFVKPSSLRPSRARAPLGKAQSGNARPA